MAESNEKAISLAIEVRARATSTRRFAKLSIVGIIAVVALMIGFFYVGTTTSFERLIFGSASIEFINTGKEMEAEGDIPPAINQKIQQIEERVSSIDSRLSTQSNLEASALLSVSSTIIRIASVVLAIYLIQILVGFTRYQFRIADHLDATADALSMSNGEPESLKMLLRALSPQHIQFGKMPETPVEKAGEIIKELVAKIPSR